MDIEEKRKHEEAEFHDKLRNEGLKGNKEEYEHLTSNRKFYSITRASRKYKEDYFRKNCRNKKVLDFCCGDGEITFFLAENEADAYGFDISSTSIENAKKNAEKKGLKDKAHFFVMDAENMTFEDNFFDYITCNGVLHHLNIKKAYSEMNRVLKPEGKVICGEPLMHNPIFQLYRRSTPHLRTKWETEHILTKESIEIAGNYFGNTKKKFFHLFVLIAVPFRNTIIFKPLLYFLEMIDAVVLKIPGIKWWAWQIIFILSNPKKSSSEDRKIKEIEYYDHEAKKSEGEEKESGSKGGFNPLILGSYKFLYELVKKEAKNKDILDYGCGTGMHLNYLAGIGQSVTGIDLSNESLKIARNKSDKVKVMLMDCEKLDFEDDSFDVIFDGGVFSSLDLDKALPELSRVLKTDGTLIGIETFGHNPITNLKRRINKILGRRTGWAAEHILKTEDFKKFRKYFKSVDVHYFHVISWAIFPLLGRFGGDRLLMVFESLDRFILKLLPFLKKYSFKVVFTLRK